MQILLVRRTQHANSELGVVYIVVTRSRCEFRHDDVAGRGPHHAHVAIIM